MNSALKEVKSWMGFMGWTDGGQPGSIKKDAAGQRIAGHGDSTWITDVEDACDKCERGRENERREEMKKLFANGVDPQYRPDPHLKSGT